MREGRRMIKSLPVHMFWQTEDFSRLARLSLASFQRHGFRVTLWSYEPDAHAMSGAGVRDARERWTFERDVRAQDPNWLLARVQAA